jgi:hypothetical protein
VRQFGDEQAFQLVTSLVDLCLHHIGRSKNTLKSISKISSSQIKYLDLGRLSLDRAMVRVCILDPGSGIWDLKNTFSQAS